MANMCGVDFRLGFKGKKRCAEFADSFRNKMEESAERNEGVRISRDTWLFDAVMDVSEECVWLKGWVKWSLTHAAVREFVETLEEAGLESLECDYEETSNLLYGKYEFQGGELCDSYVPDSHPVWDEVSAGDDDCYDRLEEALKSDGESKMVA